MEGLEKLETEVLKMNNYNVTAIFNYLKTRKDLYDKLSNKEKFYLQATYLLSDEHVIEREFGAFESIPDNYPKYVISMDRTTMSRDGIIHKRLIDFLLDK